MLEIMPVADADPIEIARISDGTLVFIHQKPWIIKYHNAQIRWEGFPLKGEDIEPFSPYLLRDDQEQGETLLNFIVILKDRVVKIVNPIPDENDRITYEEFSRGQHSSGAVTGQSRDFAVNAARLLA